MMEMFNKILPFPFMVDIVQWLAFGLNIMYVILASRGNTWCWVWGFFGTIFQFIVCIDADLMSDATLQIYYSFSAIYGWFSWHKKEGDNVTIPVTSLPLSNHLKIVLLGVLLAVPLGLYWPTAAFRYEDATLTAFSILTTFLTARKILESWLYWLVIDLSYALIYFERDKYLLTILSIVYFIFSIRGYINWRKETLVLS
jgi:nicotinamide mononucleotide transporter